MTDPSPPQADIPQIHEDIANLKRAVNRLWYQSPDAMQRAIVYHTFLTNPSLLAHDYQLRKPSPPFPSEASPPEVDQYIAHSLERLH